MSIFKKILVFGLLGVFIPFPLYPREKIDHKVMVKIREEGLKRSRVMELMFHMTEVYGPRLAGTEAYLRAARWAKKTFEEFGVKKVEIEPWGEIGLGWESRFISVHMLTPQYQPVIAYPAPWTLGTQGKIKAKALYINRHEIFSQEDLQKYRGKSKGKFVFLMPKRKLTLNFKPPAVRLSTEELDDMASLRLPKEKAKKEDSEDQKEPLQREILDAFFKKEGAAALVSPGMKLADGPMDKGVVLVNEGKPIKKGEPEPIARVIIAAEHYNRIMRLMEKGIDVTMEMEIKNTFTRDNVKDYNIIAEIPGTDLKDELVMLGGHFDGKSAGTGATDNASGSAIVMEAVRILKAIGIRPRRTIRAALWGAEEYGHRGSKAYVKKYLFDPESKKKLPGYGRFSVYFNVDWYGRFRGIYLQGNDLARPIFDEWMKPFHDLGMTHIVPGNTGGTDHMAFYLAGLPGFQFIQDDLEFFTTTFHTNMDVYDRVVANDLKQASVILAAFVYNAAMRNEKLPRYGKDNKDRRWHK
jgi:hypothetical protein